MSETPRAAADRDAATPRKAAHTLSLIHILKFWERTPGAAEMCDAFDADLAVQGEEIRRRRAAFLDGLAPLAKKNYEEISSGSEALSLCYRCGFETGGLAQTCLLYTSRCV